MDCQYCDCEGIPLDDEVLAGMEDEEEKAFWLRFLDEAQTLFNEMVAKDETPPFSPTPSIIEKYQYAVKVYDGRRYCPVIKMEKAFGLSPVFIQASIPAYTHTQ